MIMLFLYLAMILLAGYAMFKFKVLPFAMMAYEVRSNVALGSYYVFIAARSAPGTPVTLPLQAVITAGGDSTWKPVGFYKLGEAKAKSTTDSFKGYDGTDFPLGKELEVTLQSLETDDAKIAVLEAFEGEKCDILCVNIDGTWKYIRYLGPTIILGIDDKLSPKDADAVIITGRVIGTDYSDLKNRGTIAAS